MLKAKDNISEKEENDMLDYLYTSQYQMGGIVAISLGQFLCDILLSITTFFQCLSFSIALSFGVIEQ